MSWKRPWNAGKLVGSESLLPRNAATGRPCPGVILLLLQGKPCGSTSNRPRLPPSTSSRSEKTTSTSSSGIASAVKGKPVIPFFRGDRPILRSLPERRISYLLLPRGKTSARVPSSRSLGTKGDLRPFSHPPFKMSGRLPPGLSVGGRGCPDENDCTAGRSHGSDVPSSRTPGSRRGGRAMNRKRRLKLTIRIRLSNRVIRKKY